MQFDWTLCPTKGDRTQRNEISSSTTNGSSLTSGAGGNPTFDRSNVLNIMASVNKDTFAIF